MAERLIGLDAGGTMTKAALFSLDGKEIACERRPNVMQFPGPGHTERDPVQMWLAACDAMRATLHASATDPGDIAGVAITGYGAGLYLVDRDLSPVRPGIVSTDSRAAGFIAKWQRDGLAEAAGLSVQQRLWAAQPVALLAWLTEHEPDVLARTDRILFCKDYLRAQLCGDRSTDATDAGIAGMIDITTGRYAEDMFREFGLGAWLRALPEIGPGAEIVGHVSAAAARLTGLRQGTPVIRGVVDVVAAALASGVTDPSRLAMVAGTFSINQTLHDAPRLSRLPFLQCAYPIGGRYLATEGAATSASNLEWFCRVMLDAEAARAATTGRSIYDVCEAMLADDLGRANDVLFFPYLFGAQGGPPAGLLGLTAAHGLSDAVRAVYEGIVFAHRMDVEALLSGPDAAHAGEVRVAGGAARSPTWPQIFADALHMPVETMQCSELGAQGAAMCAAVGVGAVPDLTTAAQHMVRVARRYQPRLAWGCVHDRKFRRFVRVANTLTQLWQADAVSSDVTTNP